MKNHLVSTIIPAYNAASNIRECIESVLNQTWQNIEIIVVDDGSKDNTADIVADLERKNDKVFLYKKENGGASVARQFGLNKSKGDFIQFLDADDILGSEKFEVQLKALDQQPDYIAICKTTHFFNGNDPLTQNIPDDDFFFLNYLNNPLKFLIKLYGGFDYRGGMIQPNAFLVPRSVIEKAGPWNPELTLDDDGEYFCRVILNSKGICYQSSVHNYYRKYKTKSSLSALQDEKSIINQVKAIVLKYEHLMKMNNDKEMVPYIQKFLYRDLTSLKIKTYPLQKQAYKIISQELKRVPVPEQKLHIGLGGNFINKVAKVNRKAARQIQVLKSKLK